MKTLPEAIDAAITQRLEGVHTSMPGQVTRVASDGSSVDVQPLVRWRHVDENGEDVVEALPIVQAVPVVYPGAGGYVLTFPIAVGDSVLLVVSEASLDKWLAVGGQVDPGDYRRHYFGTGCVAIPGLRDFAHKISTPLAGAALGKDGGLQVQVTDTEIKLGAAAATQAAINGDAYRTAEDTLFSAIATALTGLGASIAGPLATFNAAAASYKSTTVKVKP